MVGVYPSDEGGHLVARVGIGIDGVMNEARLHRAVRQCALVAHPFIGSPLAARENAWPWRDINRLAAKRSETLVRPTEAATKPPLRPADRRTAR